MKGKANIICPKCKHCEGLDRLTKMYSCKHYNNYPDSAIGMDCEIECDNFEEVNMNKVEGKASDICHKCKNGKVVVWEGVSNIECEDPYDGSIRKMSCDSNIRCSMFEIRSEKKEEARDKIPLLQHELEMDKLKRKIHELEKEKAAHLKGIERLKKSKEKLQNQVKNLQTTNEESYKREEKLEDKIHRLKRGLLEESKRFARLDSEFLIPLTHVLYPGEAKICKPYSEVLEDIKELRLEKSMKMSNYENELADHWKRDYEFVRDKLVHPIYDILYPGNLSRDINITDLLNTIKDFKVYADENESMYGEIKKLRDMYASRSNEIDHLLSENKELKGRVKYWSDIATKSAGQIIKFKQDMNEWRSLYNSLSETCADYDKRCKEECEKKYRDEISKLQNIVTEKDVEIKGLKKEIINITFDKVDAKDITKKNVKLNQTISDQEITIKALLITIKEMCKEDETNA